MKRRFSWTCAVGVTGPGVAMGGRLPPFSRVFGSHVLTGNGGEVDRVDWDGSPSSGASAAGPQPHAGLRELFVLCASLSMRRMRKGNRTVPVVQIS